MIMRNIIGFVGRCGKVFFLVFCFGFGLVFVRLGFCEAFCLPWERSGKKGEVLIFDISTLLLIRIANQPRLYLPQTLLPSPTGISSPPLHSTLFPSSLSHQ